MKLMISALVTFAATVAFANPPAHGTKEEKTMTTTTTTKEEKKTAAVDCKKVENKDKAECMKAAH